MIAYIKCAINCKYVHCWSNKLDIEIGPASILVASVWLNLAFYPLHNRELKIVHNTVHYHSQVFVMSSQTTIKYYPFSHWHTFSAKFVDKGRLSAMWWKKDACFDSKVKLKNKIKICLHLLVCQSCWQDSWFEGYMLHIIVWQEKTRGKVIFQALNAD